MALGDEIANLDFAAMIGGPLNAVIKAQAQSAITSVDFIKSVGFDKDGKVEQVAFEYMKTVPEKDAQGKLTGNYKDVKQKLSVPLLTMLPIPFIRVEETTIDFNAKINSVQESTTASSHDLNTSLGVKGGWGPVSAELKVSYAYKKSTSATSKTERTYSMAIHVRAVQDELPAGTERLLSILENSIKETAVA
ncbi:MAG: DUF2589 domain-containing protein [Aquabacterium sp.]|jgi:hypothetical protein|uniref:DUF2589 domain-containing protein n=1 Tax=Aquabacterium sp. TaxID=1872578 RepID=UPI001B5358AB|nr:DUF2589 domain-containing protein [Aquabacterium sp.]MBP7133541.1 DUF2589 domain-containing protein [Aquabacterium sp.]MBP9063664.1 DUF2589 domain-containing protein [Aquabacterium sp.]MDQ5926720.1 hypothetical protein [Pseudomonadota bacterium]